MLINFIEQLINGLRTGSIYALIAIGYTMVYGIAKMINFAHGDIIMVGAYALYFSISVLGLPVPIALLITVIICGVLGVMIEKVAYKPLRSAPPLAVLITAIGMSFFLQSASLLIFGSTPIPFQSVIPNVNISIGPVVISSITVVTLIVTAIAMILLTLFVNKTKLGSAMRAVSEDKGAAELMGINVNSTISMTFAIGSALAAVAGVLYMSVSVYEADSWSASGYQGICSGGTWRYRQHTGCNDWRDTSGTYRECFKGIYFNGTCRCYSIWSADSSVVVQAVRTFG